MTSKTTPTPLPFPTTLIVVKGSVFVHGLHSVTLAKGEHWTVKEVRELGPDYSHATSIVIERCGKMLTFEVRHVNRLSDQEFSAQRWGKPVRFARGPQDARVRFVHVNQDGVIGAILAGDGRKVWKRETVTVAA